MLRRNDVVFQKSDTNPGWTPYGRINRIFRDIGMAEVIFVTRDVLVLPLSDLERHDYKGRWEYRTFYLRDKKGDIVYRDVPFEDGDSYKEPIIKYEKVEWLRMATLRQLKQRRYVPIWKKNRDKTLDTRFRIK